MTRTATVRTEVDHPEVIAAAVRPDNTDSMQTTVEEDPDGTGAVVTTIERATTGGLRSTVDDFVVNLTVATELAQLTDTNDTTTNE
ncbi:MAG: KEOPS complex subunit Pcc1 [Halanaeroarchaeum sp.]